LVAAGPSSHPYSVDHPRHGRDSGDGERWVAGLLKGFAGANPVVLRRAESSRRGGTPVQSPSLGLPQLRGRDGPRERQGQRKNAAHAGRAALDGQGPSIALDQLSRYVEPETNTRHDNLWICHAIEPIEDALALFERDANPVVLDPNDRPSRPS